MKQLSAEADKSVRAKPSTGRLLRLSYFFNALFEINSFCKRRQTLSPALRRAVFPKAVATAANAVQ